MIDEQLEFDHVILMVDELERAGARLLADHGLGSVFGGEHEGQGTANRIVPLGDGYLELMAIVDDSARGLVDLVRNRDEGPVALCLRTADIDGVAARLGTKPLSMSRTRPDGVILRWRLAGLAEAFTEGTPFFIEWEVAPIDHPQAGVVAHRVQPERIAWVEVGGDAERLDELLGADHGLDIRCTGGPVGVRAVAVTSATGEIVLR